MKGKWFYYLKKAGGRISASDYIFIPESESYIYNDETTHLEHCEDWATKVNSDGMNRGFEYGFEDIESPPQEWIDKKILSLQKEIKSRMDFVNFITTLKK